MTNPNREPGWDKTGHKDDGGKPRLDLIDSDAMDELGLVLAFGAKKYAVDNWRKGIKYSRLIAAALRHLFAILRGENNDPETGYSHAAHAMCCCMFIIWTMKHRKDMDDRWKGGWKDPTPEIIREHLDLDIPTFLRKQAIPGTAEEMPEKSGHEVPDPKFT